MRWQVFFIPRYPRMEWADSGGKWQGLYLPHGSNSLNRKVEDSAVPYTRYQLRDCQQVFQLDAFRASQDANQERFLAEQACRE